MSQVNKDKVSAAGFAGLASTETVNIFELGTILKISPAQVKYRVKSGTLPMPLYDGRGEREWTKAMLTTAGITAVTP